MVDQDPTHGLRGNGEEVSPILPLDGSLIDQLEVRLVDKGSRL
jgi:hypothetical protein